ncbi:MAG: hypothetical protein FWE27_04350 [Defluviitaleaceae bacterium]|nr:hypothetical protein [Defluviitaleaceae bacterium]
MEEVINVTKGKHIKIEVVSVNPPTHEEAQAKIKELSEYLSVAWVSPDNSE